MSLYSVNVLYGNPDGEGWSITRVVDLTSEQLAEVHELANSPTLAPYWYRIFTEPLDEATFSAEQFREEFMDQMDIVAEQGGPDFSSEPF